MKRITILGIVLMLMISAIGLSACSSPNNEPAEPTTQQEETEAPENDQEEAQSEESIFPRTYIDAAGNEVVIEKAPERIAVGLFRFVEHWYALGMAPMAASNSEDILNNWESMQQFADMGPVEEIGNPLNLEKLLELEPDLIIASTPHNDDQYEALSQIAPVVVFSTGQVASDWREALREFAIVVGREEEAERYIAEFDEKIQDAKPLVAEYQDQTFGFFVVSDLNSFGAYNQLTLSHFYDQETGVGIKAPEGYPVGDGSGHSEQFNLEGLALLDPDHIFIRSSNGGDKELQMIEELSKNSVWNSLTAVKNDNVHLLDRSAFSGGPIAVGYGVDAVIEILNK